MDRWTKKELTALNNYMDEKITKEELIELIPDRTWNAIRQKAYEIRNRPSTDSLLAKTIFTQYLKGIEREELAKQHSLDLDDVEYIVSERWNQVKESISNYAAIQGLGSYKLDRDSVAFFLENYSNTEIMNNKFGPAEKTNPKRWTKEEEAYLIKCLEEGQRAIDIHIPGRSYSSVHSKIKKLGEEPATNAGRKWTKEEDTLLIQRKPVPGRSSGACRSRLSALGNPPPPKEWTEEEEMEAFEKYLRGLPFSECKPDGFTLEQTEARMIELKKWATENYKAQHKGFVTLDKLYEFLYG